MTTTLDHDTLHILIKKCNKILLQAEVDIRNLKYFKRNIKKKRKEYVTQYKKLKELTKEINKI